MLNSKTSIAAIIATAIIISYSNAALPQSTKPVATESPSKTKTELESINRTIESYYLKGRADSVVDFYDKAFTYLPEYKPVIYETGDLKRFYNDWFTSAPVKSYHKTIYEVENIAGYVLETGHFVLSYSSKAGAEIFYTAKYMIMWKRDVSGRLKMISEAFGSDKFIKPEDIPYASVVVKETRPLNENIVSAKLQPVMEAYDQGVVKAVLGGDGEARAAGFTEDGIYMPHFDPMQIGMKMIRPYMVRTYKPGVISSVRDTFREIFDSGDFVFLSGHFKVAFDNGRDKGSFEGNMSNLMKRGADGKLLMYRQLAHN